MRRPSSAARTTTLAGFLTGWALFLDYLIVIALSALFLPHYLGTALGVEELRESPWDVVVAVAVIAAIAGSPARAALAAARRRASSIAGLDLATQLLLVILGLALLFSPDALTQGTSVGTAPTWDDLAFALPLAMLAYTGLETVANLAEETREPGRTLPRSLFSAIGLVVVLTALVAVVGISAFPVEDGRTALGDEWLKAPLAGIVEALQGPLPGLARRRRCASTSASPARSCCSRRRRRRSPASRGSRTRSASTGSCRGASGGSTGARSSRRRRSSPPP